MNGAPMKTATTATLLIVCQDRKGLVAAVSEFIYRHDGNAEAG